MVLDCIWLSRWPADARVDRLERDVVRRALDAAAPVPRPQSACIATCPPNHSAIQHVVTSLLCHAHGAVLAADVNVIVMTVSLLPV